jgi:hypothetical protein
MQLDGEELKGIVDIDWAVQMMCEKTGKRRGALSLRDILLSQFKMNNGHSLIVEVHQRQILSPVEVVIPNTEEAETMIARMNQHLLAFCYHYLVDRGLSKDFVTQLIKESCCATRFRTAYGIRRS